MMSQAIVENPIPTNRRKRALVVTNVLKYAIHHRLHVFRRLIDEGYEVVLVGSGTADEKADLERYNIDVRLCRVVPYRFSFVNDLSLLPTIRRLILDVKPDVLHLFTVKPVLFGKLAATTARVSDRPVAMVLSLTGLGRLFLRDASRLERAVRSIVLHVISRPLRGVTQMLTVETRSDKGELSAMSDVRDTSIVVTNGTGVSFDAFKSIERHGPITFLFAGRLLKSKGVLSYLDAASQLATEGIDARFLVAGIVDKDDSDCVPIAALEHFNNIPGCSFLGEIQPSEMPDLLAQTDVVCLPTRYKEGIPRTLLEAAASGCAFIACRTPGWVETMGETSAAGWYVEATVDGVRLAMEAASNQPEQTRDAGEAARRIVLNAEVSCESVQDRYLDAYHVAEKGGHMKRQQERLRSTQQQTATQEVSTP